MLRFVRRKIIHIQKSDKAKGCLEISQQLFQYPGRNVTFDDVLTDPGFAKDLLDIKLTLLETD